jgi:hypothetical protein
MLKSSLIENNKIQEELRNYSWKIIEEFENTLPAFMDWGYYIEVLPLEGFDNLCYVWLSDDKDIDPYQDFWHRRNRFLNLKAFL